MVEAEVTGDLLGLLLGSAEVGLKWGKPWAEANQIIKFIYYLSIVFGALLFVDDLIRLGYKFTWNIGQIDDRFQSPILFLQDIPMQLNTHPNQINNQL